MIINCTVTSSKQVLYCFWMVTSGPDIKPVYKRSSNQDNETFIFSYCAVAHLCAGVACRCGLWDPYHKHGMPYGKKNHITHPKGATLTILAPCQCAMEWKMLKIVLGKKIVLENCLSILCKVKTCH